MRRITPVTRAAASDTCRHARGSWIAALALDAATLVVLAGCATVDLGPTAASSAAATSAAAAANTPDAVPRSEPLHPNANATYAAQGRWFSPMTDDTPLVQKGAVLVYADRDKGKTTASGELYDPLAMTGAHARLPVPSYARVTNLRNGKSVIVRINDRGAFERESAIELSAAAAARLELRERGGEVEVVHLTREDIDKMARATTAPPMAAPAPPATPIATAPAPTPQPIAAPPVESAPVPVAVPALPPSVVVPSESQAEAAVRATVSATAPTTSAANAAAPALAAGTAAQSAAALASAARASSAVSTGAASPGPGRWSVQVGVFAIVDNAEAVRKRVASLLAERAADLPLSDRTPQLERRGTMTAVLVGSQADRNGAEVLADRLRGALRQDVVLVQH